MKIRSKLVISNILMILFPVLCGAVVVLAGTSYIDKKYMYTLNEFFNDENAVVSAKSTIYEYQEELWSTDWQELEGAQELQEDAEGAQNEDVQEPGKDVRKLQEDAREAQEDGAEKEQMELSDMAGNKNELPQTARMTSLGASLEEMGYHFAVFMDGDCQFSNMTAADSEVVDGSMSGTLSSVGSLIVGEGDNSVIKSTFKKDGVVCEIIAINRGGESTGSSTVDELWKTLAQLLQILLLTVAAAVFLTDMLLSGWISRSILKPLALLKNGTARIMEGDLDGSILPDNHKAGGNEINLACEDFEKMRAYLRETARERAEYEEKRREMISGISHDLRTPLAAIEGYVEGLRAGIADTGEKRDHYLDAVYTRSKDLERLVDRLSLYNRYQMKKTAYEWQEINIVEFLAGWKEKYGPECEAGQLAITVEEAGMKEKRIRADKKELERVFDNLVSNSRKYGNREICRITVRGRRRGNILQLDFEDNGPGVEKDQLSRIFEVFYRGDSARSHPGEGSGLGLAIVKDIVEAHGGQAEALNGAAGLIIRITLPVTEI